MRDMIGCCSVTRTAAAKKFGSSAGFFHRRRLDIFSDADKNRQASLTLNEKNSIFCHSDNSGLNSV